MSSHLAWRSTLRGKRRMRGDRAAVPGLWSVLQGYRGIEQTRMLYSRRYPVTLNQWSTSQRLPNDGDQPDSTGLGTTSLDTLHLPPTITCLFIFYFVGPKSLLMSLCSLVTVQIVDIQLTPTSEIQGGTFGTLLISNRL